MTSPGRLRSLSPPNARQRGAHRISDVGHPIDTYEAVSNRPAAVGLPDGLRPLPGLVRSRQRVSDHGEVFTPVEQPSAAAIQANTYAAR